MTITKKALFMGCSFTANSGFKPENRPKFHWPQLVCQKLGYELVNRAIGGMSNQEIFFRTIEEVAVNDYDLVVVMWSGANRHWVYCSDDNVDDFTIITGGTTLGFRHDQSFTKIYSKLHYAHFNNHYVNIKNWLLCCLALEKVLKEKGVKYMFVKGFDNHITNFLNVTYDNVFFNINELKTMLDFENRPDFYILEKVTRIQKLIKLQDHSRWVNLSGKSFKDSAVDTADDKQHPGPITNSIMTEQIVNFYKDSNE